MRIFAAIGVLLGVSLVGLTAFSADPGADSKALPQPSSLAPISEFHDEIERDYTLRSLGQLQITNMRGDIAVQGWSLDKIRVRARRKAVAATAEDAKRLFSALDFRYRALDGVIELAAEYGRGLTLEERLRERSQPRTSMEVTVFAPAGLKLTIWGVQGKISVKNWSASVDARATSGEINIEGVKKGGATVFCPSCDTRIKSVQGPVRAMGSDGKIELSDIDSVQTYAETSQGAITAARVRGEQLYVSKDGPISGKELSGRIEFHGGSAPVEIIESSGFLSGRTTSGDIVARMRHWKFADKAVIESAQGDIRLSLPASFSGEVDLASAVGRTEVGFPVEKTDERRAGRSTPGSFSAVPGRVVGRVGEGGELLRVFSEKGAVQVIRGG